MNATCPRIDALAWQRSVRVVVALALLASLQGCAQSYATPEEAVQNACSALGPKSLSGALIGSLGGAAGGAAIGAVGGGGRGAAIGAGVGVLAGLIVGTVAGNIADKADCREAQAALQRLSVTPVATPVTWSNPGTGSHGAFTSVGPETTANGRICRPIRADYYMRNHEPVTGDTGLVCRSATGDWARITNT